MDKFLIKRSGFIFCSSCSAFGFKPTEGVEAAIQFGQGLSEVGHVRGIKQKNVTRIDQATLWYYTHISGWVRHHATTT